MHAVSSLSSLVGAIALFSNAASASPFASDIAPSHFQFKRAAASTVVPTSPGPGDKFNEGGQCTMQWTPGTGSAWKSMTISLMTGSNEQMTVLTNVVTGLDGTTTSSYSWPCPQVSPNSAIYFYQFTDSHAANPTWTTRFTIASSTGESTTPTNSEQANGQTVQYGNGKLVSGGGSSSSGSTSGGSSGNASSSSNGSSGSSVAAAAPAVTITSSSTDSGTASSTDSGSQTTGIAQTTGTTSPFTSSSSSTSGASGMYMIQSVSLALTSLVVIMSVAM